MTNAQAPDGRRSRRSNVFLAAVLDVCGSPFPVRIRNLSPSGALVDGKDLPDKGDAVRLQRGPHSAVARIVWRKSGACGLRFSAPVPVQEWIAYGAAHQGQQCVDEMVASVRAGTAATGDAAAAVMPSPAIDRLQTIEQLKIVAEQLEEAAGKFAAIPAVVEEGTAALQDLELARQKLVDLSARIRLGGF